MVREIIGLVSVAIGLLLLMVSFYLTLRRIHPRREGPALRHILVTIVYGLLFFAVGIIIERTAPAFREPKITELPQRETGVVSPVTPGVGPEPEKEEPRVSAKPGPPRGQPVGKPVYQPRPAEPPLSPVRPVPSVEDKIYAAIDGILRNIEDFFERYGVPVAVEAPSVPALAIPPIFFDDTTTDIPSKYYSRLDQAARIIKEHREIRAIEVQSHTDGEGPEVYNFLVTQSRANAVRDYLIARGIEPDRLVAKGYGTTQPWRPDTKSGKAFSDRRIQFVPVPATR